MAFLIWIILFTLLAFSFLFDNKLPIWLPIICYFVVVIFRAKEKIGNFLDWEKISKRDEKIKLEQVATNMAQRGLTFSSMRTKEESKVKEDFIYERKKKKREFENSLINSLFLK